MTTDRPRSRTPSTRTLVLVFGVVEALAIGAAVTAVLLR